MCEINRNNFKEKLPEIKKSLEKAKFVAVDLEFSALHPLQTPSLFDNNKERYAKFRRNLLKVIPLQVGLTAFHFDNDTNDYFGEVFTFYTSPTVFGYLDKAFYFQASSMQFLCLYKFDFNKFAYLGIPYLNGEEVRLLRSKLGTPEWADEDCSLLHSFEDIVKEYLPAVTNWYKTSNVGDHLEMPDFNDKYRNFHEIIYFMHKHLRRSFKNLWTFDQNGRFCVKKVTDEELTLLVQSCKLDATLLDDLTGFKHVFDILTGLRKPLIGHNLIQDLMIMVNNFEAPLPDSYSQFKALTHRLFPAVFDTKTLFYQLRPTIPKNKLPDSVSLEGLFEYFKDGSGRHLTVDSTAIDCNIEEKNFGRYHEAGWDSFCAGYIFLRMAYFNVAKHWPKSKKFVPSEVISGFSEYKNRVNVIRGATSYISLDGEDPTSNRPPWLIVESIKNEPVDVSDLMSTLSSYGFVNIKKLTPRGTRVLVAVDTYRTAKEISKSFNTANPTLLVKQYNVLRHSRMAQAVILGAVTVSGTILLWLTHTVSRR